MKCEDCCHAEMCKWIDELEGRGCDFGEPCETSTDESMTMVYPIIFCDDAISREAVLKKQYRIDDSATLSTRDVVNVEDIEDLPPVTPSRQVIEDIKADIEAARYGLINDGLDVALRIIDKHIEGR